MKDERGKENVPPLDDISQTRATITGEVAAEESSMTDLKARSRAYRRRREIDDGACDIDRAPLGEMAAEDFYAEGCDGSSVFIIPAESDPAEEEEEEVEVPLKFDFIAEIKGKGKEIDVDVDIDALMQKDDFVSAPKAALLEPIEKAEEGLRFGRVGVRRVMSDSSCDCLGLGIPGVRPWRQGLGFLYMARYSALLYTAS